MKKRNKHIGSSLNDFLKKEGILQEASARAVREALEWQVAGRLQFMAPYEPEDSVHEELLSDSAPRDPSRE